MKKTTKMLTAFGMAGVLLLTACATADATRGTGAATYVDNDYQVSESYYTEDGYIGIETGPALLSPEDIEAMWSNMFDPETVQIIVNDEAIDAPTPFTDAEAGAIMLPLVAIAEALGYVVTDEGAEVIISPGTIVTAGVNSYFRGREAPRELSTAPVMQDDVMFVPWEFFQEILCSAAMVMDGNIVLQEMVD